MSNSRNSQQSTNPYAFLSKVNFLESDYIEAHKNFTENAVNLFCSLLLTPKEKHTSSSDLVTYFCGGQVKIGQQIYQIEIDSFVNSVKFSLACRPIDFVNQKWFEYLKNNKSKKTLDALITIEDCFVLFINALNTPALAEAIWEANSDALLSFISKFHDERQKSVLMTICNAGISSEMIEKYIQCVNVNLLTTFDKTTFINADANQIILNRLKEERLNVNEINETEWDFSLRLSGVELESTTLMSNAAILSEFTRPTLNGLISNLYFRMAVNLFQNVIKSPNQEDGLKIWRNNKLLKQFFFDKTITINERLYALRYPILKGFLLALRFSDKDIYEKIWRDDSNKKDLYIAFNKLSEEMKYYLLNLIFLTVENSSNVKGSFAEHCFRYLFDNKVYINLLEKYKVDLHQSDSTLKEKIIPMLDSQLRLLGKTDSQHDEFTQGTIDYFQQVEDKSVAHNIDEESIQAIGDFIHQLESASNEREVEEKKPLNPSLKRARLETPLHVQQAEIPGTLYPFYNPYINPFLAASGIAEVQGMYSTPHTLFFSEGNNFFPSIAEQFPINWEQPAPASRRNEV